MAGAATHAGEGRSALLLASVTAAASFDVALGNRSACAVASFARILDELCVAAAARQRRLHGSLALSLVDVPLGRRPLGSGLGPRVGTSSRCHRTPQDSASQG